MKLIKKILNKLNGLYYPQEYLCLDKESFQQSLNIYITENNRVIKDITQLHLFVGYNPLIFAIPAFLLKDVAYSVNIQVRFSRQTYLINEYLRKKDAIAWLSLKLIRKQVAGSNHIFYYLGETGHHRFLSSFQQHINSLHNRLYNNKPDNVFLPGNLYTQVQIAYSIPRIISMITVSDGKLYNLFPTDLHGAINNEYYVISLRHSGKACQQTEAAKRIVLSQIHFSQHVTAYKFGKNHMQDLKAKERFPFSSSLSVNFNLPIPHMALNYLELELVDSFNQNIHKLLLFKVVFQQTLIKDAAALAHIHNVYATWRHNHALPGNYLLW
jgi:hypothetical protein